MHETMVAQSMIAVVLEECKKHEGTPVRVKVSCGQLNALNDEVFGFAFATMAKGTACEGIALDIEHKPLQGRCEQCQMVFAVDFSDPRCPSCGTQSYQLLPDAPLLLEEIEFIEE